MIEVPLSRVYISLLTEKERLGRGSRGRNKGIAISLTAAPYITSAPLRLLLRSPLFIFPRARSSGPSSLLSIFERFTDNSQYASFHPHSVFQPRSFFLSLFPLLCLSSSSFSLVFLFSFSLLPDKNGLPPLCPFHERISFSFYQFLSFCLYVYIL